MKLTAAPVDPEKLKTDLLVLGMLRGEGLSPFGRAIDRRLDGWLLQVLGKEELQGKEGEAKLLNTHGRIGAENLLVVGLGGAEKFDHNLLRKMAAAGIRSGNRIRARKLSIEDFNAGKKKTTAEVRGQAIAEGVVLGDYSFDRYKSDESNHRKKTVAQVEILTGERASAERGIRKGEIFAEATNLARDLVNIPASEMTPRRMAEEAKKVAGLPSLSLKVYNKQEIQKMGMGCTLAVARGSAEPPCFIHLHYRPPSRARKRIAIVGKGITFDSGGLSLKTAQSMETMKDDMSGAAAMIAVMKALSHLKPPVEVHGIAAVTENMPSGGADKPGDIARAMNGKTVEILNTDAEGRLTLADALPYALKQRPEILIDMATLTGACVVALGELCSGIMGNNQGLIERLIECGKKAGEKIWQLPLIEEYKDEIKSPVADLKNVGGKWAGTITAALFLREFVDPKVPWAHIDIAGPSWTEKELDDCPKGGTGHGVRTLLHYLLDF